MAAAAPDRLSNLPDDLLVRILSFAPSREAASTTALTRRWRRPLWLETGVLNFDHRSYRTTTGGALLPGRVSEDARRAHELYISRGRHPRKVTLVICDDNTDGEGEEDDADAVEEVQEDVREVQEECTDLDVVPVATGVEEIRVERQDCASPAYCRHIFYTWMLFVTLHVIEITGSLLKPHPNRRRLEFPCLKAMRLRRCRTKIGTLEDMISAAPRLADLRLEAMCFEDDEYVYRLRCPAATVIVIADIHRFSTELHFDPCRVEVDAPCLRRITFDIPYFSFEPLVPHDLEQVELAVHFGSALEVEVCRSFLTSVSQVRYLKLTAYSLADLYYVLQYNFYNLEVLEIEDLCGWCIRNDGDVPNALVNLLRRCPGLHELRLKFSWCKYLEETRDPAILSAAMSDFSLCKSLVNVGDDDEKDCCDSLDLILKTCCGCKPDCLQSSLKKVLVQFDADELTCLQVRLIKFLAKNALALEKFVINGGKEYDSSHIDCKILRWQKRRRRTSSPLPPMTYHPLWPPPLSEFPTLGSAPDPDTIPSMP